MPSTKLDFALESFKNIQDLIRFIDQKAGALLVVYGLLITAFLEGVKGLTFVNPFALGAKQVTFSIVTFLLGAFTVVHLAYSIWFVLNGIIKPRTCKSEAARSVFYYEHICGMLRSDFITTCREMSDDELLTQVLDQVYEVAVIMHEKSDKLTTAIKNLLVSIGVLLTFLLMSRML